MDINENTVRNISDFLTLATEFQQNWFPNEKTWGPWFRGHSDSGWNLRPKLYRTFPLARGLRIVEDELCQEFVMRGPSLTSERPRNSWDWYFVMQHSGAPTRLLDWTEGALIARYFAVRDQLQGKDAAVWVLDSWWLNKLVVGEREVIAPGAESGLPTHTARRIGTQRSCFTVHGANPDDCLSGPCPMVLKPSAANAMRICPKS